MTIALYPGAFKPPHKGHFDVVKKLLEIADKVIILISSKPRDGFTAEESVRVWDLYKHMLEGDIEIKISENSPIKEVYNIVDENPNNNYIAVFGKGEIDRYKNITKYPNVKIFDAGTVDGIHATDLRQIITDKNVNKLDMYIPQDISHIDFLDIFKNKTMQETFSKEWWLENLQLDESPPINFERDEFEDYVNQNRDKIEKAAAVFNFPIDDLVFAFTAGGTVVLNDDVWSKLQNTNSYKIKSLEDTISLALKLGVNPKPYIEFIKTKKELPLPLVLCYGQDQYYLVGGEVILSLYRALGLIPTILQGTVNMQTKTLPEPMNEEENDNNIKNEEYITLLGLFLKYVCNDLKIDIPKTKIINNSEYTKLNKSFGGYDPIHNQIYVVIYGRTLADSMRSLCHECYHVYQNSKNLLNNKSGEDGSKEENDANSYSGKIMRIFGKEHPEIFTMKYCS
jgi:cytidyltransferase-like protein